MLHSYTQTLPNPLYII